MKKNKLYKFNKNFLLKSSFVLLSSYNVMAFAHTNNIPSNLKFDQSIENCLKNINDIKSTEILLDKIGNLDHTCFNKLALFKSETVKNLVDQSSMIQIAEKAKDLIFKRYKAIKSQLSNQQFGLDVLTAEERKTLLKLASILNNAYYIQSLDKSYIPNLVNETKLKSIIAELTYQFAILTHYQKIPEEFNNKEPNEFKSLAKEVYALIGSAKSYEESLNLIEYVTQNSKYISENKTLLIYAILPIQIALSASHDAGGIYFKNEDNRKKFSKIITNIQNILLNEQGIISDSFYENYILELGHFLRYKEFQPQIISTLKQVINKTVGGKLDDSEAKPTTFWLEAISALEAYGLIHYENCQSFLDKNGLNACKAKTKLGKSIFKNRFIYDEGTIVFHTALNKQETDKIYFAMKQAESKFKHELQLFEPVKNDKNKRLYVYIYPNKKDYLDFKPYASDLDKKENGGIYIDSRSAFFTYANSPSLEDLVKHEYIHYLNSRYLYKNFANTTKTKHAWKYLDWYIEGSAELFAGAKQNGMGISSVEYSLMENYKKDKLPNIYEIIYSKYESDYPDRFLLNHFLFNKKREIYDKIILSIKNNDVSAFMTTINSLLMNKDLNTEFKEYVKYIKFNESDIARIKENTSSFYSDKNLFEASFKQLDSSTSCEIISSSEENNQQARISCKVNLDKSNELSINNFLDRDINHSQTNCFFNNTKNLFFCEGSVLAAKKNEVSSELINRYNNANKEQFDRIFPIINDNFFFYKGDIYSSYLAKGNREEGWYYNYYVKDKIENFKVDDDGEYSLKNVDNFEKVPVTVEIQGKEIELSLFKFRDFDKRMFVKRVNVKKVDNGNGDAYDFASHSLYRNEGSVEDNNDGFRIFDDKFRYNEVNDFDFVIDSKRIPKGAIAEVYNRYMLYYVNRNPKQDDKIFLNVFKHGNLVGELELKIDNSSKSTYLDELNKKEIKIDEEINFEVKERYLDFFVYDHMSDDFLESGIKYNYTIIQAPKCHTQSSVREDGHFRFVVNKKCTIMSDDAVVAVTKVTNKKLEHQRNIKINFNITYK